MRAMMSIAVAAIPFAIAIGTVPAAAATAQSARFAQLLKTVKLQPQ